MKVLFLALLFCVGLCGGAQAAPSRHPVPVGIGVQVKEWSMTLEKFKAIREAGFDTVRFVIPWEAVEATVGTYDFTAFDKVLRDLRAAHLRAVIVLAGGHSQITGTTRLPKDNLDHLDKGIAAPATAGAVEAFARYAAAVVARYRGADIVWEIWNEPDLDRFWLPDPDAEAFARLASATCAAVRQVDPDAVVIGPALAGIPKWPVSIRARLLKALAVSPAGSCLDALSMHPYRRGDDLPESAAADIVLTHDFMARALPVGSAPMPVVSSEWGYTTKAVGPDQHGAYLLRALLTARRAGAPLAIWYEWQDTRDAADGDEAHYGLLARDGRPKEGFEKAKAVLAQIGSLRFLQSLPVHDARDVVLIFQKPEGGNVLIAWTTKTDSRRLLRIKAAGEGETVLPLTPWPMLAPVDRATPSLMIDEEGQTQ